MSKLAEINLDDAVNVVSVSTTAQVFTVTFDPRVIAEERVTAAIRAGGAEILPGPPTPVAAGPPPAVAR